MSAPLPQAGYRPASPGRSATQAYHWPQVGQHPQNTLKREPGPWCGWQRHCQRFTTGPRRLCMASDLTQLHQRAS